MRSGPLREGGQAPSLSSRARGPPHRLSCSASRAGKENSRGTAGCGARGACGEQATPRARCPGRASVVGPERMSRAAPREGASQLVAPKGAVPSGELTASASKREGMPFFPRLDLLTSSPRPHPPNSRTVLRRVSCLSTAGRVFFFLFISFVSYLYIVMLMSNSCGADGRG